MIGAGERSTFNVQLPTSKREQLRWASLNVGRWMLNVECSLIC